MRRDYKDAEDVGVEGTDDDHKLGLGDGSSPGDSDNVIDGPPIPSAGRSQQESMIARLKLATENAMIRRKETEWQIKRERMAMQRLQSSRCNNETVYSHSDVCKQLPRMSSNDSDVLSFRFPFM